MANSRMHRWRWAGALLFLSALGVTPPPAAAELSGAALLRAYEDAVAKQPLDAAQRLRLASLYIRRKAPERALAALATARLTASPQQRIRLEEARANALLMLGRNESAWRAVREGLRRQPTDAPLVERAAQVAFHRGATKRAQALYLRAATLDPTLESSNVRLGGGFGAPLAGAPWRNEPQRSLFSGAVAAWTNGKRDEARERFHDLVVRWPGNFKYRLGLGIVIREQRLIAQAGNHTPARYRLLPAPPVASIERFVPQWPHLTADAKHVIRVAVAPAARWIPVLLLRGARHDILSMDDVITEAADRKLPVHTFDGRRWRQLRGVGGKQAATGMERLRLAMLFSFNVFAHEFAHQLLTYGFSERLKRTVNGLYTRALASDACLDYYAASNVDEYFAQGYEAYVSLEKNTNLRETAGHTRDELRRRDPALYAFLRTTLNWRHEDEGLDALRAFWAASDR